MQHFQKEIANICNLCSKKFTAKKNLLKHLRDVHKNFQEAERIVVKKIKCPAKNCAYLCRMMKDLRHHIQMRHNIQILYDILQFSNEIAFQEWKQDEENNTSSSFVTNRKKTTLSNGTKKQILYCHRTGQYNPKGFGKYRMRSIGSCKIGVTCPAAMEITEYSNNHISVIYYKTHLGHFQDIVFLKLSKEEKVHLAEQIEKGFTFDAILENEKECTSLTTIKTKRIHLISKKDLNNIMKSISSNKIQEKNNELKNKSYAFPIEAQDCIINEDSKNEKFKNISPQSLTLFSENNKTLNEGILFNNNTSVIKQYRKSAKHSSLSEISKKEVTAKIVILPSQIPSMAEVIFSADENFTMSKFLNQKNISNEKEIKLNRGHLKLQLKEKMESILRYIPKTELLTPKQFGTINIKLDSILNIFNLAENKSDIKKTNSKKIKLKNVEPKKKKK